MNSRMLVVTKFGGSSLSCAKQFQKVKNIVLEKKNRGVVVVSAPGKVNASDNKITDLLYLLDAHIKYNVRYDNILNMIKERYLSIRDELKIEYNLESEFALIEKIIKENKQAQADYLVSRGEYLCAKLMSSYLGYNFIDAKDLIIFNYDGRINENETVKRIIKAYKDFGPNIVVPGFYGSYANGDIHLLSRGGSDVTGAFFAKALNASLYENWTDVSGILMADPRIVANPKRISEITYDELREMSYMGANVLHEETIFPVQEMSIPINILNTNDPTNPGTIITNDCNDTSQIITGISGKKDFTSITITKAPHANKTKIIKYSLDVLSKYNISIEGLPSSIDSFSLIVQHAQSEKYLYDIIADFKKNEEIIDVSIDKDIALVAVVGRNMVTRVGISGKIFALVGENNINIKTISQGSHELAIIFGISNKDFEKTIQVIYNNLVK